MLKRIDTSIQDWASSFLETSNYEDRFILPASVTDVDLAKYISAIANETGGNILLGAYSDKGVGSGFQNVDADLVKNTQNLIEGVEINSVPHQVRLQNIYLLEVEKADSLAFADGCPYSLRDGKPRLMAEREVIEKLGLGVDSSLINMISEQITKQSGKVDVLTEELKEKSKIKNQVPGLLVGGNSLLNISG